MPARTSQKESAEARTSETVSARTRDRDARRGAHREPLLPVEREEHARGVLLDAQVEPDGVGQDERTQRERVGTDGRQDEGRHRRLEDRTACREVVGGGTRRRRDDEAVSPVARHRSPVDVHPDRGDARERRLAEDGVVHDAVGPRRPPPLRDGHGQEPALLEARRARERRLEDLVAVVGTARRQEPEGSDVDPEDGDVRRRVAGDGEERAVSAERHEEVDDTRDLRPGRAALALARRRGLEVVHDLVAAPREAPIQLAGELESVLTGVTGDEAHPAHPRGAPSSDRHPESVAGFLRNAARYSTFPSAPVIGDGATPRGLEAQRPGRGLDARDRARPHGLVADDAAAADLAALRLELRLHEDEDVRGGGEERHGGREDERQGDEREIPDEEGRLLGNLGAREKARVHLLPQDDARVPPEPRVELSPPHVHGVDAGGAAREEDVREPARRRAKVETDPARGHRLRSA